MPDLKNSLARRLHEALFKADTSFRLADDRQALTSEECSVRVSQYIAWLNQLEVQSVLMVSSPSIDALCMCYALLLCNKTYIPIHPSTAAELIEHYLQNYEIDLLLVQPQLAAEFSSKLIPDPLNSFHYCLSKNAQPGFCLLPGILFFTSGSTDQPKAVHYHYETLARYLSWGLDEFRLNKKDNFLFTTELTFVASLRPLFIPVLAGAGLIFPGSGSANKLRLIINALVKQRISVINLTPTLFKVLVSNFEKLGLDYLKPIRLVLLSGEALDLATINAWFAAINSETVFYNLYGATEYLVPFYKKITAPLAEQDRLHLGQLRSGCSYKLMPQADRYELCVAGDIATAYFDCKLSQTSFQLIDNQRYIKTNDLLRIENNELYFCSRAGRLVKKFGQLVNLDQIEYLLKKYHADFDLICFQEEGGQRIHLVICTEKQDETLLKQIKQTLKAHLPHYMHPDEFVFSGEAFFTASGKRDYRQIRERFSTSARPGLSNYFQRFFPDHQVDLTLRIVDLGLESIDYIDMGEAFLRLSGKWLDLTKINEHTRIADIDSCLIDFNFARPKHKHAVLVNPIQEASYSQELYEMNQTWKCLVVSFALQGDIDLKRLEKAIAETLDNHFILLSRLQWLEDGFYFIGSDRQAEFRLKMPLFFPKRALEKLKFSIYSENLVRIYLQRRRGRYFLTMVYHHVAIDGWSAMLVREEIFRRYEGREVKSLTKEEEINYLNLVNQAWLRSSYNLDELRAMMAGINPYEFNQLDALFCKPIRRRHSSFCLDKAVISQFVVENGLEGFTYSVIFAYLFHRLIALESGQEKLFINISFSNRNLPVAEAKKLITNLAVGLPVFLDSSGLGPRQFARQIQTNLTAFFKNMSFGALAELGKNEIIGSKFLNPQKQPYTIIYTYINKICDEDYVQSRYIDWENSMNRLDNYKKKLIYLRVYNLGSQFVVYFDSHMKAGCHERMMRRGDLLLNLKQRRRLGR